MALFTFKWQGMMGIHRRICHFQTFDIQYTTHKM